jgi:hypothetical protein
MALLPYLTSNRDQTIDPLTFRHLTVLSAFRPEPTPNARSAPPLDRWPILSNNSCKLTYYTFDIQ